MNKKLYTILEEVFDIKESLINDTLTKKEIDNWDSLTQMDLINSLEEGFDVELSVEEIVTIDSVISIKNVLSQKGIEFEL